MPKNLRKHAKNSLSGLAFALLLCLHLPAEAAQPQKTTSTRTLRSMARAHMAFNRYDKAEILAKTALTHAKTHKTDDAELAMCLIDLGTVYQYQDKLAESEQMLTAGIALQKANPDKNPWIAYTLRMLSSVNRRMHRYEQAQALLDEALTIMLDDHPADDPKLALFHTEQAKLLTDQNRLDEAYTLYSKALTAVEAAYGQSHLCTANVYEDIAALDLKSGRCDEAVSRIDRTIYIRQNYYGPNHPAIIPAWLLKAQIRQSQGDPSGRELNLQKALAAATSIKDPVQLATLHRRASEIRKDTQLAKL
ncbi:MAG: tetratricopeptide repeat protein [Phycisphaerae bacterium]|nr:tetratricopeptide repeat protein [Phycisphaerae bacterium]